MDYDFITTVTFNSTGVKNFRAHRGTSTDVSASYSFFYRKVGDVSWTETTSGTMEVTSTGDWQLANDWNESAGQFLTHSWFNISGLTHLVSVEMTSPGATVGNYFMYRLCSYCADLVEIAGYEVSQDIINVGTYFLSGAHWHNYLLTTMGSGIKLPMLMETQGERFLDGIWEDCRALTDLGYNFTIPPLTNAGNVACVQMCDGCWALEKIPYAFSIPSTWTRTEVMYFAFNDCTAMSSTGTYVVNLDFYGTTSSVFGGTNPITPDGVTAASSVPISRNDPYTPPPTTDPPKSTGLFLIS